MYILKDLLRKRRQTLKAKSSAPDILVQAAT